MRQKGPSNSIIIRKIAFIDVINKPLKLITNVKGNDKCTEPCLCDETDQR